MADDAMEQAVAEAVERQDWAEVGMLLQKQVTALRRHILGKEEHDRLEALMAQRRHPIDRLRE